MKTSANNLYKFGGIVAGSAAMASLSAYVRLQITFISLAVLWPEAPPWHRSRHMSRRNIS